MTSYLVSDRSPSPERTSRMICRLLPLAALAAVVFVPAAVAAPPAAHTVRGTVVAKDRAHHALVLALPGGSVQAVVVPGSLARVTVGRKVAVRTTVVAGRLATATRITVSGRAQKALVRGTIVRIVKRRAVLNAGGTILAVTLHPTKSSRTTASATSGPKVGDVVKAEVEIDDDGSLDADHVVVVASQAGVGAGSAGEMEVRGKVTVLVPATADASGTITVDAMGLLVSCVVPVGRVLVVEVGTMIELECNAVGSPAVWTVRGAHDEDEHATKDDDDDASQSEADDDDPGDDDEHADESDDDHGSDD